MSSRHWDVDDDEGTTQTRRYYIKLTIPYGATGVSNDVLADVLAIGRKYYTEPWGMCPAGWSVEISSVLENDQ